MNVWEALRIIAQCAMAIGPVLALYFCLGRVACPTHDRLPLRELSPPDVWATTRRGWNVIAVRRCGR